MRIALLLMAAAVANGQTPPAEGMKERTNMRGLRYCEVLVVKGSMLSLKADVYNTVGLNECPPDQWAALDADKLKKQFGAKRVVLNGPRHFLMDRNALQSPGKVETFQGLQARLLAQVAISASQILRRTAYTDNAVERKSQYVFEKGKYVYELVTPAGVTYIMQTYSLEIDKTLNEDGLQKLGPRLKLPKGWKYQARKLDADLVVRNQGAKAYVLQDDFRNSYQRM